MKSNLKGTWAWTAIIAVVGAALGIAVSLSNATTNNPDLRSTTETNPAALSEKGIDPNLSKAVLAVSNLSCGGCVDTIKASLAPLPGIGEVSVDVGGGSAAVLFDSDRVPDPLIIATTITEAGYPATIEQVLTADQARAEQTLWAERAKTHIASVGKLEIPRQDYETELAHAQSRYKSLYGDQVFDSPRGAQVLDRIKAQIVTRLISDGVKLQEVQKSGYQIPPQKIDQALKNYLDQRQLTLEQLKKNLDTSDYRYDYFQMKFTQRVLVQTYIEEKILSNSMDADERQQRYANWLTNAKALSTVTYYDTSLKALTQTSGGSGCGGGGCGGSSCSLAAK